MLVWTMRLDHTHWDSSPIGPYSIHYNNILWENGILLPQIQSSSLFQWLIPDYIENSYYIEYSYWYPYLLGSSDIKCSKCISKEVTHTILATIRVFIQWSFIVDFGILFEIDIIMQLGCHCSASKYNNGC